MQIRTDKKTIIIVLSLVGIVLMLSACFAWLTRSMSLQETAQNEVKLERYDRYVLLAGNDTIMSFSHIEGDSAFYDGSTNMRKTTATTTIVSGQWVNSIPAIPSCNGRIMTFAADSSRLCKAKGEQLISLLRAEAERMKEDIATIDEHKEHIDYYLRTHNVTDDGFDVVARLDRRITLQKDSLNLLRDFILRLRNNKPLKLRLSSRYFTTVKTDSGAVRVECNMIEEKNGMLLLRTNDNVKPDNLSSRLHLFNEKSLRKALGLGEKPRLKLPKGMIPDSLGVYYGATDSVNQRHGYGLYFMHNGDYFEGDWVHGARSGFGLSLNKGKRMRIGEWDNDRYLGERITYTADRIYGIDISRHQHEKGRKRYSINWKNLSITSLGRISKKKITGTVNYPVSFVYIKTTEGTTIFNRYFAADYKAARQHGYKVGCYHFFSTRTSGIKQARFFLKRSRYTRGDFPPVLDVEPTAKMISKMGGANAMFREIRQWLNAVESAWGVRPVLYVSQSFVNKYLPAAPDLMKNYNVWIARYGEYRPNVNLIYWQLSPDGRVNGIHGDVDINVFNGFASEWEKYAR